MADDDDSASQAVPAEELVMIADRGRFSLRLALWLGGGGVAAATVLAQFQQAILGLFHQ